LKAKALRIIDEAVLEAARSDRELWVPRRVKLVLVDAYRMNERITRRPGPGWVRAAWPETFEPGDYPPEKTRTSPYATDMTITRMERILFGWKDEDGRQQPGWFQGLPAEAAEPRQKLEAWVKASIRGESSTLLCARKHWSLATFKRHRDTAAGLVARRLNSLRIPVY
jgi:hypothetical protein